MGDDWRLLKGERGLLEDGLLEGERELLGNEDGLLEGEEGLLGGDSG